MQAVPKNVEDTFDKIKESSPSYIVLKIINNRYYVYRQATKWDKQAKKLKTSAEYLGRITELGEYIKKSESVLNRLDRARILIEAHGGKVILPEGQSSKPDSQNSERISDTEKKLLTILSMNARADLSYFSRELGIRPGEAYRKVKSLEEKYAINYVIELDLDKLGFIKYIAFVKFEDNAPSNGEITEVISSDPRTQLVALTSGSYDMMVYFLAKDADDASDYIFKMQKSEEIGRYTSRWYASSFDETYGFIPLGPTFFELIGGMVWKRSAESSSPKSNQLLGREYYVLKEMSRNSQVKFNEIDEKYKLGRGTSYYTYLRLKEKGIIKRATITMGNLPVKYLAGLIIEVLNGVSYFKTRKYFLLHVIAESNQLTDRYLLIGDITLPHGSLCIMPVYTEEELQKTKEDLSKNIQGIGIRALTVTQVLFGSFGYRRFDNAYSVQFSRLVATYGLEDKQKVDYDIRKILHRETRKRGTRGELL